jgi:hypothetical protein
MLALSLVFVLVVAVQPPSATANGRNDVSRPMLDGLTG